MKHLSHFQLLYLAVVSAVNVFLAYRFGADGYEIFLITIVALAVLLSWLTIQLIRRLFATTMHPIFKLVWTMPLLVFWFFGFGVSFAVLAGGVGNPQIETPDVNVWLVLCGVIPYLVPRLGLYSSDATAVHIGIGLVATFISILVLFIAIILFHDPRTSNGDFLLILATQLQLVMNYLLTRTNYMVASHAFTVSLCHRFGVYNEQSQSSLTLLIAGAPFLIPVITICAVGTVGY